MFIAPIAKSTDLAKTIAKSSELTKSITEDLHNYIRYDARNAVVPAIKEAQKEVQYFSPSTPTKLAKATLAESVGKVLDFIQ